MTTSERARERARVAMAPIPAQPSQIGNFGPMLEEGAVVRYEGRVWRVGLVNASRARLDPASGISTVANPVTGRAFLSYGTSVSITPHATHLEHVIVDDLDDMTKWRLVRLQERADMDQQQRSEAARNPRAVEPDDDDDDEWRDDGIEIDLEHRAYRRIEGEGDDDMADVQQSGVANAAPAIVKGGAKPNGAGAITGNAAFNKQRLAALAAKKAADPKVASAAAGAVAGRKPKKEKVLAECKCGCGGATSGNFVPGHDARFKGLLLQVERGKVKKEDVLTAEVIAAYKWVKRGDGWLPTTNYKGEKHSGYDAPKGE